MLVGRQEKARKMSKNRKARCILASGVKDKKHNVDRRLDQLYVYFLLTALCLEFESLIHPMYIHTKLLQHILSLYANNVKQYVYTIIRFNCYIYY